MAKQKLDTAKALATFCAKQAIEKLATDVRIIHVGTLDGAPSEYFVIATCASEPQVRAVAEAVEVGAKGLGVQLPKSEGWEAMQWVVIDFFDVVVHVFRDEAREFYKLDKLWGDAESFSISPTGRMVKYKG